MIITVPKAPGAEIGPGQMVALNENGEAVPVPVPRLPRGAELDAETVCARRATRIVCGGATALSRLKRAAHRRDRRVVREGLRTGNERERRRVTGHEVA